MNYDVDDDVCVSYHDRIHYQQKEIDGDDDVFCYVEANENVNDHVVTMVNEIFSLKKKSGVQRNDPIDPL